VQRVLADLTEAGIGGQLVTFEVFVDRNGWLVFDSGIDSTVPPNRLTFDVYCPHQPMRSADA
jgi:hypothetical protein